MRFHRAWCERRTHDTFYGQDQETVECEGIQTKQHVTVGPRSLGTNTEGRLCRKQSCERSAGSWLRVGHGGRRALARSVSEQRHPPLAAQTGDFRAAERAVVRIGAESLHTGAVARVSGPSPRGTDPRGFVVAHWRASSYAVAGRRVPISPVAKGTPLPGRTWCAGFSCRRRRLACVRAGVAGDGTGRHFRCAGNSAGTRHTKHA